MFNVLGEAIQISCALTLHCTKDTYNKSSLEDVHDLGVRTDV